MKILNILFLLFVFSIFSEEENYKKYINFTQQGEKGEKLQAEEFAGFDELRRWALFQSLTLHPDSPLNGLKDGICRMIPQEGLDFYLSYNPTDKRKIYIYFDLTTYSNLGNSNQPDRTLFIKVNGRHKSKVIFSKTSTANNPHRISIDPSEAPNGRINISLQPDSALTGRFWGIWDVFYSYAKE
jgi:hypothetical protein